ncbi:MAG: hypothetical protein LBK61_05555 [Spirochaetaceae bacterium]|nr:hypothetical protein [Spirochaetaceae bacterium]
MSHDAPAGGENPQGFHPFAKPSRLESYPNSGRRNSGRQECPCGERKPAGFSSLCESYPLGFHPCFCPIPYSGRRNSGMAGRAPPYGGCASPSGAQCRHKGVLCLPGTMPDRGRMDK